MYMDCVSCIHFLLDQLIFDATAKTKLASLAFLYYEEIVENSIEDQFIMNPRKHS